MALSPQNLMKFEIEHAEAILTLWWSILNKFAIKKIKIPTDLNSSLPFALSSWLCTQETNSSFQPTVLDLRHNQMYVFLLLILLNSEENKPPPPHLSIFHSLQEKGPYSSLIRRG